MLTKLINLFSRSLWRNFIFCTSTSGQAGDDNDFPNFPFYGAIDTWVKCPSCFICSNEFFTSPNEENKSYKKTATYKARYQISWLLFEQIYKRKLRNYQHYYIIYVFSVKCFSHAKDYQTMQLKLHKNIFNQHLLTQTKYNGPRSL